MWFILKYHLLLPPPTQFFFFWRIHLKCPSFTVLYIFLLVIDPDFWFLLVVKSREFLIMIYFLRCLITFDSKPDFSERCFCEGNLCMVGCGCIHMEYLFCDPIVSVISGSVLSVSLSTFLSSPLSFFISNTCGCPTPVWLKRIKNFWWMLCRISV